MPPIYQHEHPLPPESDKGEVVERVEWTQGARIYLQGHPHPIKGYPTAEAIVAINIIKKLVPFWFIRRLRTAAMMALYPFLLKPQFMLPVSRELRDIFGENDFSLAVSHIVEYDSAYRVRLQSMLNSVSPNFLSREPICSVLYMLRHNRANDYEGAHRKIRFVGILLCLFLLVPSNRRRWRQVWRFCSYINFIPDEADHYWFKRRTDYGPNNPNKMRGSIWGI